MITERGYARDVTADDIRELIAARQPELNELEYKQTVDSDLLKAACAIANFGGGFILIGIEEDISHRASGIISVELPRAAADSVRQKLRDGLTPRPVIEVVNLSIDDSQIIVVRLAPQNGPHMISQDKRTDFYGRYDATSERMRYDEIEQGFREKINGAAPSPSQTTMAILETAGGRADISLGAKGALEKYESQVRDSNQPSLALIAVSENNHGSISENDAKAIFEAPSYARQGGWLVLQPKLKFERTVDGWLQRYAGVSNTLINSSGDLTFVKAIDEVLCWKQSEVEFEKSPRLYPNALVEYALSFMYAIGDIAVSSKPEAVFVKAIFNRAETINLPPGEGGSIWFDAPVDAPRTLPRKSIDSQAIVVNIEHNQPLRVRHEAYNLISEIYGLFGYLTQQIPFVSTSEVTFEADSRGSKLGAIKSHLQMISSSRLAGPSEDFDRGVFWFRGSSLGQIFLIGVSEELVEDWNGTEQQLFSIIDPFSLGIEVREAAGSKARFLIHADGKVTRDL